MERLDAVGILTGLWFRKTCYEIREAVDTRISVLEKGLKDNGKELDGLKKKLGVKDVLSLRGHHAYSNTSNQRATSTEVGDRMQELAEKMDQQERDLAYVKRVARNVLGGNELVTFVLNYEDLKTLGF